MSDDTRTFAGGPLIRYGGKGHIAPLIVPHFAPSATWVEPCFGGGSVFYAMPRDTYPRAAVNDIDRSIVTFFSVLRDDPDGLVRLLDATPYARDEFAACRDKSDDPMEEARRVWVRSRQAFSGSDTGGWKCNAADLRGWAPTQTRNKIDSLKELSRWLQGVAIDNVNASEFVDRWGQSGAFVYADPPYPHETRDGPGDYRHEMTDADHRRLAASLRSAVDRGAKACVSSYPSSLYDELFAGWRRIEVDVSLCSAGEKKRQRRTECLWMSYPESESFVGIETAKRSLRQPSLF